MAGVHQIDGAHDVYWSGEVPAARWFAASVALTDQVNLQRLALANGVVVEEVLVLQVEELEQVSSKGMMYIACPGVLPSLSAPGITPLIMRWLFVMLMDIGLSQIVEV